MEVEAAKALERQLLNAGAIRVLAFGEGVSEFLAVELPADADARHEIFQSAARYDKNIHRNDLTPFCGDSHQHYLLLRTSDDELNSGLR
jgi:hypothetical protein